MANIKSAVKRIRQDRKRRLRNRALRSRMRTQVKALRSLIDSGDATAAASALKDTIQVVDATAQKGAVHRNAAARTKSRLHRAVQRMG